MMMRKKTRTICCPGWLVSPSPPHRWPSSGNQGVLFQGVPLRGTTTWSQELAPAMLVVALSFLPPSHQGLFFLLKTLVVLPLFWKWEYSQMWPTRGPDWPFNCLDLYSWHSGYIYFTSSAPLVSYCIINNQTWQVPGLHVFTQDIDPVWSFSCPGPVWNQNNAVNCSHLTLCDWRQSNWLINCRRSGWDTVH